MHGGGGGGSSRHMAVAYCVLDCIECPALGPRTSCWRSQALLPRLAAMPLRSQWSSTGLQTAGTRSACDDHSLLASFGVPQLVGLNRSRPNNLCRARAGRHQQLGSWTLLERRRRRAAAAAANWDAAPQPVRPLPCR